MTVFTYKIQDFEGPLDLLLHLVSVHKMDLFDIRIYELIDQYLEFMGHIGAEELESASEFVAMAAKLVYMKSVALLPRNEETVELERELTGQLIEYSLCKIAASKLKDRSEGVNFFVRTPAKVDLPTEYNREHKSTDLLDAFLRVQGRTKPVHDMSRFEPIVTAPVVSVESRVVHIMGALSIKGKKHIRELFEDSTSRSETVATFLGVLELVRGGDITIDADGNVTAVRMRGAQ